MFDRLPAPEVIITHESDLDGLVAGILLQRLARKLHGVEVRLEAWNYNYWKQRDLRERAGWITDLTFESRMDRPNWLVVDHHVTEATPKSAVLIHDISKSASLLCYDLCRQHGLSSPALDRLVHLSNVADLFLEEDPEFVLAVDYASLVKNYQFWNLHALIEGQIERLLDHPLLEVMEVKRRVENPIGLAWSRANISALSPTVGFVDTVIGNNNYIVHQLLEDAGCPFPALVTLFRRSNGVIIVSIRSRNGEALKIAEKLQGGGHANACAATLPRSIKSLDDAAAYLRQILNPPSPSEVSSLETLFETGR